MGIVAKAPVSCKNGIVKKKIPISECRICSKLKGGEYADFMKGEGLSNEALEIVGNDTHTGMYQNLKTCPVCGRYYSQTNDCGFMEDDVSLTLITPTEAGDELTAEEVDEFFKDLNHTAEFDVTYATSCLADHFLSKKTYEKFDGLLKHPSRQVRLRAIVEGLAEDDKGPLIPLYKKVIETDTDQQVRGNAIRLFCYDLDVQAHALDFLTKLVKNMDKTTLYDAATALDYFARNKSKQAVEEALKKQGLTLARVGKVLKTILEKA